VPRGTTKRRPITVAALLDAAFELFAEQGYGATSVADIAARAGLTKGAFYSNFESKDALFLALFDQQWRERATRLRQSLPMGAALMRALEDGTLLRSGDPEADRRWLLISTEFSLHAIRNPEVARLLVEHEKRGRAALAELIDQALRSISREPAIPLAELTRMVVAVVEGIHLQALTEQAAHGTTQQRADSAMITLLDHLTAPTRPMTPARSKVAKQRGSIDR
jgi:AcrR family transcriptional regulator